MANKKMTVANAIKINKKMTYAMAEKMETPKHKKMEIAMAKKALAKKPMHLMPNGKMMPGKKHKKK